MKKLLSIYKTKLIGLLLFIIGATFFVGTILYLAPRSYNEEPIKYLIMIKSTFKYTIIIVVGLVLLINGIGIMIEDSSSIKLINNIREAFTKEK